MTRPGLTLLALAAALAAACGSETERSDPGDSAERRRDVLLVVLDTTRADHLGSYGYSRDTTPQLDRLATEGVRFDRAWAHAPWTLPTMASILTGQPPWVHGADRGARRVFPIRDGIESLAARMRAGGYETAAFVNVLWCAPELSHLDRGFDVYDYSPTDDSNRAQRRAGPTTDAALAWIDRIGARPFFLAIHYFDPHLTYDAPAPYGTMFDTAGSNLPPEFGSARDVFAVRDGTKQLGPEERASLVARYDGELRYVDEQFGRLRAELERRGRWEDTLVVVVGDHGEEFWDHGGFEHGHSHHREMLRVPLLVRRPGGPAGAVHNTIVHQIDIAPTVLEFAGLPAAADLPGRSLFAPARSGAESIAAGSLWAGDLVSIRSPEGTVIHNRTTGSLAFYAVDDPGEQRALPLPASGRSLLERADSIPSLLRPEAESRGLDPEQLERLRSLGYAR